MHDPDRPDPENAKVETPILPVLPRVSRRFSKGAASAFSQCRRKSLNNPIGESPISGNPECSTRLIIKNIPVPERMILHSNATRPGKNGSAG